jgi:hypothetical protein
MSGGEEAEAEAEAKDGAALFSSYLTTEVWFRLVDFEGTGAYSQTKNDCSTLKPVFCFKIVALFRPH